VAVAVRVEAPRVEPQGAIRSQYDPAMAEVIIIEVDCDPALYDLGFRVSPLIAKRLPERS
jgi:hypothetical protein